MANKDLYVSTANLHTDYFKAVVYNMHAAEYILIQYKINWRHSLQQISQYLSACNLSQWYIRNSMSVVCHTQWLLFPSCHVLYCLKSVGNGSCNLAFLQLLTTAKKLIFGILDFKGHYNGKEKAIQTWPAHILRRV